MHSLLLYPISISDTAFYFTMWSDWLMTKERKGGPGELSNSDVVVRLFSFFVPSQALAKLLPSWFQFWAGSLRKGPHHLQMWVFKQCVMHMQLSYLYSCILRHLSFPFTVVNNVLCLCVPQPKHSGRRKHYPIALVLAPTRELALQIHAEGRKVL